jgi:hypothetical protein
MTVELDYNIKEERLFNECIDTVAKSDPKKYCLETIAEDAHFEFWNKNDIENTCKTAST